MWLRVQVAVGPDPAGALAIGLCHEIGHAARDLRMAERVGMQGLLDGVGSPPVRAVRVVRHFPMSENYPVFKQYLEQALQKIEARLGTRVS
jgi:hypothetical protein